MQITKQTDYALRAIFTLVEHYGRNPIPIGELARRNDAPKRFLEHIMLELKGRGWVKSAAGKKGGYFLALPPEKVSLGEIVRHFDGRLAPINCVSDSCYERCSQEPVCRFRRVFLDARNYVTRLMDSSTLAAIALNAPVSRAEVMAPMGMFGDGI